MKVIKFKKLDNKSVIFNLDNNTSRLFCIDRMFKSDIPINQQYRWKKMYESNQFFSSLYINTCGEPTWGGWVELIDDDIIKYTSEYKEV